MNIIVDLSYPIKDGAEVKFRSPVDCSQVTGLVVNYNGGSQEFVFADAHGNNVGDIDHLFAENVVVKVILDVTTGMAFVQNADTNAYLEAQLANKAPAGYGLGETKPKDVSSADDALATGWYQLPATSTTISWLYCTSYSERYKRQESYNITSTENAHKVRYMIKGVWQDWEWIDPPMIPGVEYRTTERLNGEPVYTMAVDCGSLPDSNIKYITFLRPELSPESSSTQRIYRGGIDRIISFDLTINSPDGVSFSMLYGEYAIVTNAYAISCGQAWDDILEEPVIVGGGRVDIETAYNRTDYTGQAIVKYTKKDYIIEV